MLRSITRIAPHTLLRSPRQAFSTEDSRRKAHELLDLVLDYLDNVRELPAKPSVQPNEIYSSFPSAPQEPIPWDQIKSHLTNTIFPKSMQWAHPNFLAFYPSRPTIPGLMGNLIATALSKPGFTWETSQSMTEIEYLSADWLAELLGLPEFFQNRNGGHGMTHASAGENVALSLRAAINRKQNQDIVVYISEEANTVAKRAAKFLNVKHVREVPVRWKETEHNVIMNIDKLQDFIKEDKKNGLVPGFLMGTIGTTGTSAVDPIQKLGEICQEHDIWYCVDAAYAGPFLLREEFAHRREGLELADSIIINGTKSLFTGMGCSVLYVKNRQDMISAYSVDYHMFGNLHVPEDMKNMQMILGKTFSAMQLWMVLSFYGASGLRAKLGHLLCLATRFENYVISDTRLRLISRREFGLVCFAVNGPNQLTDALIEYLKGRNDMVIFGTQLGSQKYIRVVVGGDDIKQEDVDYVWKVVQEGLDKVYVV